MSIACDKHRENPVKGYSGCPGCEVERLTQERAQALAELAALKAQQAVKLPEAMACKIDDMREDAFWDSGFNACLEKLRALGPLYTAPQPAPAQDVAGARISVATLRWWLQLATANPADLVPRISSIIAAHDKQSGDM